MDFRPQQRHIVWMNDMNTICSGEGNGRYFGSCDLRENNPKWKKDVDDVFHLTQFVGSTITIL